MFGSVKPLNNYAMALKSLTGKWEGKYIYGVPSGEIGLWNSAELFKIPELYIF